MTQLGEIQSEIATVGWAGGGGGGMNGAMQPRDVLDLQLVTHRDERQKRYAVCSVSRVCVTVHGCEHGGGEGASTWAAQGGERPCRQLRRRGRVVWKKQPAATIGHATSEGMEQGGGERQRTGGCSSAAAAPHSHRTCAPCHFTPKLSLM
jgi:hypothetical protein